MAIASGDITITTVNDGYTVLLTPDALNFTADFDGSHPDLSNAVVELCVTLGGRRMPFRIDSVETSPGVTLSDYTLNTIYESFALRILSIPIDALSGYVKFQMTVEDGYNSKCNATLRYSVLRQSGMLDWIMDWEGSKTKIGSTYVMTPKMFIGRKDQNVEYVEVGGVAVPQLSSALTGVYVGPEEETTGMPPGIYGFLSGDEIFHINSDGGNIGGWSIHREGLLSPSGDLSIKSSGSIEARDNADILWGVYESGDAVFAKGNVHLYASGDADFRGTITSTAGQIGGWTINDIQLYGQRVALDSSNNCLGVTRNRMAVVDGHVDLKEAVGDGGVMMYYSHANDFGLIGHTSTELVFQLGSTNKIGCWNFTSKALYTGVLDNAAGQFTSHTGYITIGSRGIRGFKWRIEDNGTAAFSGGFAEFREDSASFYGWNVVNRRFSDKHTVLVSDNATDNTSGLYISGFDLSTTSIANLKGRIQQSGGVYITSFDGGAADLFCYDTGERLLFSFASNGSNNIGPWNFDHEALWCGNKFLSGFTDSPASITIGNGGLRGFGWRLEADGTGSLAMGRILWDRNGNARFEGYVNSQDGSVGGWDIRPQQIGASHAVMDSSGIIAVTRAEMEVDGENSVTPSAILSEVRGGGVMMHYTSDDDFGLSGYTSDGTRIFSLGSSNFVGPWNVRQTSLYLGAENDTPESFAANDTDLTIGSNGIRTRGWRLEKDGSGALASGMISWGTDGGATFQGRIIADSGLIGGWALNYDALYCGHVCLDADFNILGITRERIRLTDDGWPDATEQLTRGGIGLFYTSDNDWGIRATDKDGNDIFQAGSDNFIGPWHFAADSIYTGVSMDTNGVFTYDARSITIGLNGIRGFKWRLEADGGGALAGGNISWNDSGFLQIVSGKIADWEIRGEDLRRNRTYLSACEVGAGLFIAHDTQAFEAVSHDSRWASILSNGGAVIADVPNLGGVMAVSNGGEDGTTFLATPVVCSINKAVIETDVLSLNIHNSLHGAFLPAFLNTDETDWDGTLPEVKEGVCVRSTILGRTSNLTITCGDNVDIQFTDNIGSSVYMWKPYKRVRIQQPFILELYGYRDSSGTHWMIRPAGFIMILEATD